MAARISWGLAWGLWYGVTGSANRDKGAPLAGGREIREVMALSGRQKAISQISKEC